MKDDLYARWLAERRDLRPPADLVEQVMSQIMELEHQRQSVWWLSVLVNVERSRIRRWAVCGGSLAVGSLPFLFLAYVAQFVGF